MRKSFFFFLFTCLMLLVFLVCSFLLVLWICS